MCCDSTTILLVMSLSCAFNMALVVLRSAECGSWEFYYLFVIIPFVARID